MDVRNTVSRIDADHLTPTTRRHRGVLQAESHDRVIVHIDVQHLHDLSDLIIITQDEREAFERVPARSH